MPPKTTKPSTKRRRVLKKAVTPRAAAAGSGTVVPSTISSTLTFYLEDFPRTLFPLKTNRYLIQKGEQEVCRYITKCLDEADTGFSFASQRRVYADKPGMYLRRTVKLDVAAEYYVYDLIFRNRNLFRKPHTANRVHYGYRFERGAPIPATAAYKGFKGAIAEYAKSRPHFMSFDVASYFNSVYHHDLVGWFSELGASEEDVRGIGQLLREINSGRSVDCLPQGLYPTKMIGNDFLRFLDNHHDIKATNLVRFMDDICLFSESQQDLHDDFRLIQRLLGDKGLSVNPAKTKLDAESHVITDKGIDEVKRALLKRRRLLITEGYDEAGDEITKEVMVKFPLNKAELEYVDAILERPDIEEEDAELLLTIMRQHASRVERRLPYILRRYPHLTKAVHAFCAGVGNKEPIAEMILDLVKESARMSEFQLFWLGAILDDYLMETAQAAALIAVLLNHGSATVISRAKILEIADHRFGLTEIRNEYLSGQSDWLAWASAVGSMTLTPVSRNHRLKYFGKTSQLNNLVSTILMHS
jgi:hypothetical protein